MEGLSVKAEFHLEVLRADGKLEDHGWWKNLFVQQGMSYLATLQSTTVVSQMNFMNVGTVSTAATLSDSALTGAVGSRATMASRTVTGANCNILSEVATFSGFISGIKSLVLREIGIFNANVSGGVMRSRAVFASITLADSDFLQVTYQTTVGSM